MSPDDPRHGTVQGRAAHRRDGEEVCDPCKAANALYQRRYRKTRALYGDRTLPVLGTRRRVEALMCLGWSMAQIAPRVGMDQKQLWTTTQQTVIRRDTAARIADVYEQLAMTVPPADTKSQRISVAKTLNHARRNRFAPPLAWDDIDDPDEIPTTGSRTSEGFDPVVVERLIAGHRVPSTNADKVEAMRRWMASGRPQKQLCNVHHWKEGRYVVRQDGAA